MDPATYTALSVTIYFCAVGGGVVDGKCSDGSAQQSHNVRIIERTPGGQEKLFEYDENGTPKFTLYPDGSITRDASFHVDDVALAFWQAIAFTYKDACPSLSTVIDGLKNR